VEIEDADDEAECIDVEPSPSGVCICVGIEPRLLMPHIRPVRLADIVCIPIGRDDAQIVRSSLVVHYEYAYARQPRPAASCSLAASIWSKAGLTVAAHPG
jgi:hypothetical protein